MGRLCLRLGQPDFAELQFKTILQSIPNSSSALSGLVDVAMARDDAKQAQQLARKIFRHDPQSIVGYLALAHAFEADGLHTEAMNVLAKLVRLFPNDASARYHWGRCLLKHGDLDQGWPAMTHVYDAGAHVKPDLSSPWWTGEAVDHLLVVGDQGLGDTIMLGRFLYPAQHRVGQLTLACDPALVTWLSQTLPVQVIAREGMKELAHDAHLPIGLLPGVLGLKDDPYQTQALTAMQASQPAVLPGKSSQVGLIKIGVSLECSNLHSTEQYPATRRSHNAEHAQGLLAIEGAHFYNIQKQKFPQAQDLFGDRWHETADEIADFTDTVSWVQNMDAIISIDSVLAHVAGVLGKPSWVILPRAADWRWQLHPSHNPWYPSVRLKRETPELKGLKLFESLAQDVVCEALFKPNRT
jgi:hypothetical protein